MVLQVFIFCSSYLLLTFSQGAKFMDCVLLEFIVALKVLMCSCGTQVILGAFGVFLECGRFLHGYWRWFLHNTHMLCTMVGFQILNLIII
jgi:hypothetical protein